MRRIIAAAATAILVLSAGTAKATTTPEQRCEGSKNDAAGKYEACVAKAQKGYATDGNNDAKLVLSIGACESKYSLAWQKAEATADKAGKVCPSMDDEVAVQGFIDSCSGTISTALHGDGLLVPDIVTCSSDLATCSSGLGTCTGSLGTCGSNLSAANINLGNCTGDLATCTAGFGTCSGSLTTCTGSLSSCSGSLTTCSANYATCSTALAALTAARPLKTGVGLSDCWSATGLSVPCFSSLQDGETSAGVARAFTNNGNGTISDVATGLMWEQLTNDGVALHDKDTTYTWANAYAVKIAGLNAASYGGHTDWRLPNVRELETLAYYGPPVVLGNGSVVGAGAAYVEFSSACPAACTIATPCSCTLAANSYWSSTTYQITKTSAWAWRTDTGDTGPLTKSTLLGVRGVRGGL